MGGGRLLGLLLAGVLSHIDHPAQVMESYRLSHQGGYGMGCAISPTKLLTATHVIRGKETGLSTEDGPVQVLSTQGDLALLRLNIGEFKKKVLKISGILPIPGDLLYYSGVLYDDTITPSYWGTVLAYDKEGYLVMESSTFPGTSGTCVLNAEGEVVGVLTGVVTAVTPKNHEIPMGRSLTMVTVAVDKINPEVLGK